MTFRRKTTTTAAFTIYNYLNPIAEEDPGVEPPAAHAGDTERTVNP